MCLLNTTCERRQFYKPTRKSHPVQLLFFFRWAQFHAKEPKNTDVSQGVALPQIAKHISPEKKHNADGCVTLD